MTTRTLPCNGRLGALPANVEVKVFRDHLADEQALVERLQDFAIIVAMRERTPFTRSLLARLPQLKLLITTGMRNASIDVGRPMTVASWCVAPKACPIPLPN